MKSDIFNIVRIIRAFGYSASGLKATYISETAFRQEVLLCVILIPLGIYLGDSGVERALLVGSLLIVLLIELLNSAVEVIVDRISKERHELSGRAKDIGSAAVFVALLNVVMVWAIILWDKF